MERKSFHLTAHLLLQIVLVGLFVDCKVTITRKSKGDFIEGISEEGCMTLHGPTKWSAKEQICICDNHSSFFSDHFNQNKIGCYVGTEPLGITIIEIETSEMFTAF